MDPLGFKVKLLHANKYVSTTGLLSAQSNPQFCKSVKAGVSRERGRDGGKEEGKLAE